MESDAESIRQSGGEAPTPRTFIPPESERRTEEKPKVEATLNIPGYTGPEKPIFESKPSIPANQPTPSDSPTTAPPPIQPAAQQTPPPAPMPTTPQPTPAAQQPAAQTQKSPVFKTVALITGIIAAIVGLGILGYFVIFPLIFSK